MALVALVLATFLFQFTPVAAVVLFCAVGLVLNRPKARMCLVTLSVPEILTDVLDAFKLEIPELFQPGGFGTDFSSKTAVLGDKITAKISHVPTVGSYDPNNGGFENATQDVTTLLEDVPVTLNQFPIVTIKVGWLTQLSSKIELYKEAIRNYGFALAKSVVDSALATITAANFSNSVTVALANTTLDTFDTNIRNQCNLQKMFGNGRYCILNTPAAGQLGQDDRVRSSLFYAMLNGDNGYRLWRNLAGFKNVREYPDFTNAGGLSGFAGDARAIAIASRRPDFSNVAEQLGVPKVMDFNQIQDPQSGLYMTGVAYQKQGTGDVIVAAGVLFGVGAGKQGGANGTITDNAGVRLIFT